MNPIESLNNINTHELLTEDQRDQLAGIFQSAGMGDWEMDTDGTIKLRVKLINKSSNPNPVYQKEGDSGFDLMANLEEGQVITLDTLDRAIIPTGIFIQIPVGYELQVRPRSGLAIKNGITVLNAPGTVDAGYRGEVGVILINLSKEPFTIKHGDRIAQGVIAAVQNRQTIMFKNVNTLDSSDRGAGGFGSTGV